MDGIDRQDGGAPGDGTAPPGRLSWAGDDDRIARFSGVVGEVTDPLTWGLDLEDESLTGPGDEDDPTCERFVRAYRCFTGEALEVETLRAAAQDEDVEDVVRAACSGALAAPLHADIAAPVEPDAPPRRPGAADAAVPDFADSYEDYRSAMRALVAEVDEAPLRTATFDVDGEPVPSVEVTARGTRAVYVVAADRALVVTGPADLLGQVDVVTRPVADLIGGQDRRDGRGTDPEPPGPPVPPFPGGR
ncbi:hypothetical protein LEP48_02440 [Isoptericola sp. NEAU-Y5]|uniref:Uncharacterized protein n=1 Tax=Isoptericola luteus TaxID=2879484 RepID=A0ABS7ZCP4_9MICO|nr:hypothetical protein [Isoptericola sp. NEAU-Y5]MCA5892207.1 hypothetical protein [Isoptericola sp. NEAU-Y5]